MKIRAIWIILVLTAGITFARPPSYDPPEFEPRNFQRQDVDTLHPDAQEKADRIDGSVEEDILIARQIWEIDSLNNPADKTLLNRLVQFLNSNEIPVARAAARKFALPQFHRYMNILEEKKDNTYITRDGMRLNSRLIRGTIEFVLSIAHNSSDEIAIQSSIIFLDTATQFDHQTIGDDLETIFRARNWIDKLPTSATMINSRYENFKERIQIGQISYMNLNQILSQMKDNEKISFLIDKVWNYKTPSEYEAAINILIEDFGKEGIPPILEKLGDTANLPQSNPPPYDKLHSRYRIALDLIKSIPDERTLPLLEKLSQSKVDFVANEARDAIKWVRSGVPYPYKYRRLMMAQYY